jgi:hypothetical protein
MTTSPPDATQMRVLTYPVKGRHGTSYKAEVKGPGTRTYIGTFSTEPAAYRAGEAYLRTGRKPEPAKRGPKGPRGETWDDVPRQSCSRPAPSRTRPERKPAAKPATSSPPPDRVAHLRQALQRWEAKQ